MCPGALCRLHKNDRKFFVFLCNLTIDFLLVLWYNISVKRRGKVIQGRCDLMTIAGRDARVDRYRPTSVATLEKILKNFSKTS